MNGYFGHPLGRKDHETQVATPVGQPCILCDEPVEQGDIGTINAAGQIAHHACTFRQVVGSVGHQLKKCSCYGGTEEDPPGLTRKEAAIAALHLWDKMQSPK